MKRDYPQRFARDCGESLVIDDLIARLAAAPDSETFCDVLDEYFLQGCWKDETEQMNDLFLKDVRGIMWLLAKQGGEKP